MDFFGSISVPFYTWQVFCLSPFSLTHSKRRKSIFKLFSFAVITLQALVIILSLTFPRYIVYESANQTIKTFDMITMSLAQVTALVTFFESYRQRHAQGEFLRKINSIDVILEFKIGTATDYTARSKTNIKRFLRWIILDILVFVVNLITLKTDVYRWWIVLYSSFFICSLRYFQIVTCVDILHHRLSQMEQFIKNLSASDDKIESLSCDLMNIQSAFTLTQKCKKRGIYEKIVDLRRVCRLISSANRKLNEAFKFSLPMLIVNDFLHIMVNSYWFLVILLSKKESDSLSLIGVFFWTVMNLNHLISLSSVCHHAAQVVEYSSTLLSGISFKFSLSFAFRLKTYPFTYMLSISVVLIRFFAKWFVFCIQIKENRYLSI